MIVKAKAAAPTTASKNTTQIESYHDKRRTAITKHRADIPERYRATFDWAVLDESLLWWQWTAMRRSKCQ
jgi:hypothetical protein